MRRRFLYASAVLATIWLIGIAAHVVFSAEAGTVEPSEAESPPKVTADTGAIIGKVTYNGDPPFRRAINFGANLDCKKIHSDKVYYEEVVINENGTLKNVLVYIKGKVRGDFKPPEKPVVLDQKGCVFHPHGVAAMVGQPLEFLNSDPMLHNIRTMSKENKAFNISQPKQGTSYTHTFDKPEIGIPIRCDVHHWMASYLHILPHPFFAVTNDKGTFKIEGLPPRTYTLEVWHEKHGTKQVKVEVKAGEVQTVDVTFSEDDKPSDVAKQ